MNKDVVLKVGTQVAYIPSHVREECGDDWDRMIEHDDTEFGFVSSWNEHTVFVRFWSQCWMAGIRTLSTSEGCSWENLELYNSHAQFEVLRAIERFRENSEKYGWHEQETEDAALAEEEEDEEVNWEDHEERPMSPR